MLNEGDRHFKNLVSATQILKKLTMSGYTGKYTAQAVHMLLDKYGIKPKTYRNGVEFYNKKNAINCIEMHIYELFQTCEGLKAQDEENAYYDGNREVGYGRDDMSTVSRELLANDGVFGADENELYKTEGKCRKITITESQFIRLVENNEDEGFSMKFSSPNVPYEVKFEPNKKGGYSDTSIFKEGTKEFNVRIQELPKSGLKSINLYFIKNMNINKAVKHGTNINGQAVNTGSEEARNSIEYFKKRSAYYVTRILSKMGVSPDLFTCPESSSNFNKQMLNLMSLYYPNGNVMLMPDVMEKNVNNVTMDIQKAKELGLTDEEIAIYQGKISKMKDDEKIREYRREIEALKTNIEKLLTHKRGRPSKNIANMKGEIDAYNNLIRLKRGRGRDSTVDANGNIKSFQIKSLDDRQRRILDGLFTFNTRKYPSRVYNKNGTMYEYPQYMKLSGKVVVVFDDNISSGATLDMLCNEMKKYNPKMIIPITLGQIPLTSYDLSMRGEINKGRA